MRIIEHVTSSMIAHFKKGVNMFWGRKSVLWKKIILGVDKRTFPCYNY